MEPVHVIVGAGQAGSWAAMGMRQAGFGGRIVLIGDEPWHPYERPPLSKGMLMGTEEPPVKFFQPETVYGEKSIDLMLGTRAEGIDVQSRHLLLDGGKTQPFDKLLLATGGQARRLTIPGAEHVHYLRGLDDARALRKALSSASRVVCIGAGVIGLEVAASAKALGASVVVLEAGATPMGRSMSAEGAAQVNRIHRDAGVDIHYNVSVQAIVPVAGRLQVECADGSVEIADVVLAAIGMERNLELARQAGLEIDGGIVVDAFGQSSVAGIYAAGDVAAFPHPAYGRHIRLEAWAHAQNHGMSVGRSMAGDDQAYSEIPWFWSDQHGSNIQVVGMPSEAETTVVRTSTTGKAFTAVHLSRDGTVVGVTTFNNPGDIRAGRALIKSGKQVDQRSVRDASTPLAKAAG